MINEKSKYFAVDRLAGVVLLLAIVWGAWQAVASFRAMSWNALPESADAWRTGELTAVLNRQFEQQLPARAELIGFANGVRYKLTGGAGEQVFAGSDGWLFLAEELMVRPDAEQNLTRRIEFIARLSKSLAAEDVQLFVALVPDKARIYRAFLPFDYPAAHEGRYNISRERLLAAGVNVVDLRQALQHGAENKLTYYRTDTHWNQQGARQSAFALAGELSEMAAAWPKTQFETNAPGTEVERPGDLMRLMGVAEMPAFLRPASDQELPLQTRKRSENAPAAGLFGDQNLPAVLAGTSYSLRGNFHGFLQEVLSVEVLNVARDGSGFLQSIREYLKDDAFLSSKPQVLIWELPERFLTLDLNIDREMMEEVDHARQHN